MPPLAGPEGSARYAPNWNLSAEVSENCLPKRTSHERYHAGPNTMPDVRGDNFMLSPPQSNRAPVVRAEAFRSFAGTQAECLGQKFERMPPRSVVVDHRRDHELVRFGRLDQRLQALHHP